MEAARDREELAGADGWERSARQLALNTPSELLEFQDIAVKILGNIAQNPTEARYLSLKLSNKLISTRVLGVKGGLQFLLACGFSKALVGGDKVLTFDPEFIEYIPEGLEWLSSTVAACQEMAAANGGSTDGPCADCIVQLKFSAGGGTAQGGFMRGDVLGAVLTFARCFFSAEKKDDVVLMHTHSAVPLTDMDRSLESLGLSPRATLIATTSSSEARSSKFQETRAEVIIEIAARLENAEKARLLKLNAIKEKQELRLKVLKEFEEDRGRK